MFTLVAAFILLECNIFQAALYRFIQLSFESVWVSVGNLLSVYLKVCFLSYLGVTLFRQSNTETYILIWNT